MRGADDAHGTLLLLPRFPEMARKPVQVRIVEEGGARFLLKTFADGTKERVPIESEPAKKRPLSSKIAWYRDLKTGRKKFY